MKKSVLICGLVMLAAAGFGESFNYDAYDLLLSRAVETNGLVNYWRLQAGQSALDRIVEAMQAVTLEEFAAWPEPERMAFLINAYNIRVLHVLSRQRHVLYKMNGWFQKGLSVSRFPGFFDELSFQLLGRGMTLDSLESELQQFYKNPAVHLALVKGAKGSPPLRPEAYRAEKLEEQLKDQTAKFVADPQKFHINALKRRVSLSPVFKALCEDCRADFSEVITSGGDFSPDDRAMLGFIASHVNGATRDFLLAGDYSIEWLKFDWMLNEEDPPVRVK